MLRHCSDARFVWNLGHQQRCEYRPGRGLGPMFAEQCRQLTEARAAEPWLAAGSQTVQQQALYDLDQAWRNFFAGSHRRPHWRKQRRSESFGISGVRNWRIEKLNRRWSRVLVPKVGLVRFRCTRSVPDATSYRITRDPSGRWHVIFVTIPDPIPAPNNGRVVGVDRGVTVSAALSTGEMLHCPTLSRREQARLRKACRRASRAPQGSDARAAANARAARLRAREKDIRKDWFEKLSTDLARRFDVIRMEDLNISAMTRSAKGTVEQPGRNVRQKAGLNRAILAQGWGFLARRANDKAPGRVEKVRAAYTSLRCSDCGWIDKNSRESQAGFVCSNCGFTCNADFNAAINIAAGHAGGTPPSVREPQRATAGISADAGRVPTLELPVTVTTTVATVRTAAPSSRTHPSGTSRRAGRKDPTRRTDME